MTKDETTNLIKFGKTLNILYVEDNEEVRTQTLKMLENFFSNIVVAVDGEDGLKKYKSKKFHLIISDINMPKKNGLEMLKDIKSKNDDILSLIISAYNESDYFIDAIEIGVDGFLLKPVKTDQFSSIILKTIRKIKDSQALKELSQTQEKLASLGSMMDAIAHQWKQPLNMIAIISSGLNAKFDYDMDITSQEIKNYNSDIIKQSNHLAETLDEFRSFFRPKSISKNVSVEKLITEVLTLMKLVLIEENIEIGINCDKSIEIDVIETEFKHIFINLINNSKDAFSKHNIENKKINFDVKKEDDKVIIKVSDNAGGIPDNIIDHIFTSNFTTKEKTGGSGVGLHMTKQIVEKTGATIEVKNIDNGVCFSIVVFSNS